MGRGEAKRLRAELEMQSRRRERRRYPAELRERAVSYALRRREAGASDATVAAELGLRVATLRGWRRRRGSGFRPVEVIVPARAMRAAHATAPVERVVVTTPRGLRIEGLGLDDLVRFVAELG